MHTYVEGYCGFSIFISNHSFSKVFFSGLEGLSEELSFPEKEVKYSVTFNRENLKVCLPDSSIKETIEEYFMIQYYFSRKTSKL